MTELAEALERRDLHTVMGIMDDEPHQGSNAAAILDAWSWASTTESAPQFARSLLRVLHTSFPAVQVSQGWAEQTGLALAERAMEAVDDADGPSIIHGTLVTLDPHSEAAVRAWIDAVLDADGYFYPESLYRAYDPGFQPALDPARRDELRAIHLLASFSLTSTHGSRDKALAYLARDRNPTPLPALERAHERLERRGGFTLPSPEELRATA